MMYRFFKRSFDLLCSVLALTVLSPAILLIACGIKLSSAGPVFYKSERIGRHRHPFTMFKFRTMHLKSEQAQESQYLVNQARIFEFGSFLRKSKLDELPQLLNVLLGDMSIVGPRPYGRKFTGQHYVGKYEQILDVRPGLACLDSLYDYTHGELFVPDEQEYRQNVLPVRTELARLYVARKGVGLDVYCILRTVGVMFAIVVLKKTRFVYTAWEKQASMALTQTSAAGR